MGKSKDMSTTYRDGRVHCKKKGYFQAKLSIFQVACQRNKVSPQKDPEKKSYPCILCIRINRNPWRKDSGWNSQSTVSARLNQFKFSSVTSMRQNEPLLCIISWISRFNSLTLSLNSIFKTVRNFSAKSGALRRKSSFHIRSNFCSF